MKTVEVQDELPYARLRKAAEELGVDLSEDMRLPRRVRAALKGIPPKQLRYAPKAKKAAISSTIRWAVWERDNFTCKHCGTRQFLSVDHIVPEALGGLTILENLQTLCSICNSKKGKRT